MALASLLLISRLMLKASRGRLAAFALISSKESAKTGGPARETGVQAANSAKAENSKLAGYAKRSISEGGTLLNRTLFNLRRNRENAWL
jgi:hypothetical protein